MDLKELILDTIDEDFIISLVEGFGGRLVRNQKEVIIFTTICHGGNKGKLYYYKNEKTFNCYTECGFMDVFNFISHVKDCDFSQAISFLKEELQLGYSGHSLLHGKDFKQLIYERDHKKEIEAQEQLEIVRLMNSKLPEINPNILNYFDYNEYLEWEKEGFESWTLQEFGICYHHVGESIIIPHYNEKNEVVGIRKRTFNDYDLIRGKYMPLFLNGISYAHSLGKNLYGLNKAKKAIKATKRAIVVESEKAVIKSYQWFKGASITVAACSFNLTTWQIYCLVIRCGIQELIFSFDCDYIGCPETEFQLWMAKLYALAKKVWRINPNVKITYLSDDGTYLNYKENCFDKQDKKIYQKLLSERKELKNAEDNM